MNATQPRRISQTLSPYLISITRQHCQGVAKCQWIRRRRPSSQPEEEETYFSPSGQLEFSGSGRQPQQMADSLFSLIARLVSLKGHLPLP